MKEFKPRSIGGKRINPRILPFRYMNLKNIKIGYVPYNNTLASPGDRRRFCYYARERKIDYEIATSGKKYDIVILSQAADLSYWCKYKKNNTKIVFDFIDSYLAVQKNDIKGILRGAGKYLTGQNKYLRFSYKSVLEEMCQNSCAVICSTEEQKKDIEKFNKNVHIILDIQAGDIQKVKEDYSIEKDINIVWEGLPYNIASFQEVSGVLNELKKKYKISLHLVTDLRFNQYLGKFGKKYSIDIIEKIFQPSFLYAWNEHTCSTIITSCDLAIIPLSLKDSFACGKPENKLLLFWRMGMPTIVSATPAYKRAMGKCGLDMVCSTSQEWTDTLEKYINDKSLRELAGKAGHRIAMDEYGVASILAKWDRMFESILD
ncbi:MAG: hypothetical protein IT569_01590 [Leptospiraceae bacterium]|nr:hypothetical protein [Leptospiraceae bacterium]